MNAQAQDLQPVVAKKSLLKTMASRFGMEAAPFEETIKKTVMPASATNEQVAAFLIVADQYDLNPITREIHAFPSKGGGITPVVGIDGWINLAQRRHEFDGMEFDFDHDENGKPKSCTCAVYRKDRGRPIVVTEYMAECSRNTDPWKNHPRRMLRHKAAIQAIRYAFGFSGIKDEDDAEVIYANATVIENAASEETTSLMAKARDLRTQDVIGADPETKAPEWPKKDEKGIWRDSRGLEFIPEVHGLSSSGAPSVTKSDGVFTKKRGCDPSRYADMERKALDALNNAPELSGHEETQSSGEGVETEQDSAQYVHSYPDIREAITKSATLDACDIAEDMLRYFEGPDDQVTELHELAASRRKIIESLADEND